MAAFDTGMPRWLRSQIAERKRRIEHEQACLAKLPENSQSGRAKTCRDRIDYSMRLIADLERLIVLVQNADEADARQACCSAVEMVEHDENCETRLDTAPTVSDMRTIFGEPVEGRDYDVMPGGES